MAPQLLPKIHDGSGRLVQIMKCFASLVLFSRPLPNKEMKLRDVEVEILPGAVVIPSIDLIVPLPYVQYIKTGEKPQAEPAPAPKKSEKAKAPRTEGKKSPAKKPAKSKSAVRAPKKVRGESS